MTKEEIELFDLTNEKYKALLIMQGKAFKKVLNFCKEDISDLEKIEMINENLAIIDTTILTELQGMKKQSKLFLESYK